MKYKILELLKQNTAYISGEEIGKTLNITRSAVWKNISKLKEIGYNIDSVTNKGYMLNSSSDILNEYEIKCALKTKNIGKDFQFLKETDSTNEEAKRLSQSQTKNGFLIVAENQTKGKGRLGNSWSHSYKANLSFSIVLKPNFLPNDITSLTLITGMAICKAFRKLGISAFLKWPNDIIINGKKAVGILTEISCEIERINYVIVGIGININEKNFSEELKEKATSLFIETGKEFKRIDILNSVLLEFEEIYGSFTEHGSFEPFLKEYESLCLNIGKKIKAISKQGTIYGTAAGVSDKGELIIKSDDNNISIVSGEVSVRLQDGRYI